VTGALGLSEFEWRLWLLLLTAILIVGILANRP